MSGQPSCPTAAARSAAEQLHGLGAGQRTPTDDGRCREPVSALAQARDTAARLVAEDSRRGGPTPPLPGVHRGYANCLGTTHRRARIAA